LVVGDDDEKGGGLLEGVDVGKYFFIACNVVVKPMQRQRRHLSTPAVAAFGAPVGINAASACFDR
jgi:hypothetical protein